jgi:hypothetical protein
MLSSSSNHLPENNIISFFMTELYISLFISCGASGLFPKLGYCEYYFSKHGCTSGSIISWITFLQVRPRIGIAVSFGSSIFRFLRNLILLSIVVALIYIPINSVLRFHFPQILTSICCCLCYWWFLNFLSFPGPTGHLSPSSVVMTHSMLWILYLCLVTAWDKAIITL